MRSLAAAISVSSFLASLHLWAQRFLTLATLEGRQAGRRLLAMLGLALLAAALAITGWLGLLAGIVVALVDHNIVSWGGALGIAALLSFAGAGGLVLVLMRRSAPPLFAATRRQLGPPRNLEIAENEGSPPLDPCEQAVESGRMAACAEYHLLRNSLRRSLNPPLIIGGSLLAGIAIGYLGRGRRQAKEPHDPGRPRAWKQVLGSLQVLTSLWIALHVASRPPASGAPTSAPKTGGDGKAMAAERHES